MADTATGELDDVAARIGRVIRAHRAAQDKSLAALARASGLSKTILGRIEAGDGNPSIETLFRISRALAVPLASLLGEDEAPRVRRIAARSGDELHSESGMRAWLVYADGREHRSELLEIELPKGVEQRSEPHMPGTEELVLCVRGRLRVGPLDEPLTLGPGEAAWFAADVAHAYVAERDARALCWMLYGAAR